MKKNKIAFTLVEIIVVSAIIVLLGSSGVFYFFEFSDKQQLIIHTDILQDNIDDLDAQIKKFEISDYNLYFQSAELYYTGSINTLGTDYPVYFSVDDSLSSTFGIEGGSGSLAWSYTIYREEKEVVTKVVSAADEQSYTFEPNTSYIIDSKVDNKGTNSVFVNILAPNDIGIEFISGDGSLSNKNNIISSNPENLELILEKSGQQQTITFQ